jgi:putative phosphoribosyl transferase
MYFSSRMQAGRMLASQLLPKYRYENCAVIALDDGGVVVGAQIAIQLHCIITLLATQEINLPREPKAIAGVTADGKMAYNQQYSQGEIDELVGEYRTLIEAERIEGFHEINRLIGSGGLINRHVLQHMNIILVSDGLSDSMKLDLALEYLKPINIESLVVALPIASVPVIDRVHVIADGVYCLNVTDDYIDTNHYYEKNDLPDHEKIMDTIENIVLHWK